MDVHTPYGATLIFAVILTGVDERAVAPIVLAFLVLLAFVVLCVDLCCSKNMNGNYTHEFEAIEKGQRASFAFTCVDVTYGVTVAFYSILPALPSLAEAATDFIDRFFQLLPSLAEAASECMEKFVKLFRGE